MTAWLRQATGVHRGSRPDAASTGSRAETGSASGTGAANPPYCRNSSALASTAAAVAAEQVAAMVARISADTSLRRVGDLAAALGLPVRRLQRLFTDYVGVSPKWVMRRARLQEAAVRAEHGGHDDWATLATDLGYADQAHLTRDFTATIGAPPARYVSHPTQTLQIPRVKP